MAKSLYIIRGCSGSGKSTFAEDLEEAFHGFRIEADMYMYDKEGVYDWQESKLVEAHTRVYKELEHWMARDLGPLIISDTNTEQCDLQVYLDLAEKFDYRVTSLVVEKRHEGTNSHDVPEETLALQETALRDSLKLR